MELEAALLTGSLGISDEEVDTVNQLGGVRRGTWGDVWK